MIQDYLHHIKQLLKFLDPVQQHFILLVEVVAGIMVVAAAAGEVQEDHMLEEETVVPQPLQVEQLMVLMVLPILVAVVVDPRFKLQITVEDPELQYLHILSVLNFIFHKILLK